MIDKNIRDPEQIKYKIQRAYSNMQKCDVDGHYEGSTMWYSIALDWEEHLAAVLKDTDNKKDMK